MNVSKYVSVIVFLVLCVKFVRNEKKSAKIMSGLIAHPKQFPFMVSLQIQETGQHFCGGTIINSRHILTAAHCMYLSLKDKVLLPVSKLQVRAGSINIIKEGKTARVSKIFIHDKYESRILDNDIAILRLSGRGLKFSSAIQPATLSSGFISAYLLNNIPCTILGWGRQCGSIVKKNDLDKTDLNTDEIIVLNGSILAANNFTNGTEINSNNLKPNNISLNSTSDTDSVVETFITSSAEIECVENFDNLLRYAVVPIRNSSECAKDYREANITDNLICAGTRGSRIDSCKGDSGGPLVCNEKIEGIVSFGDGCDNLNHLGVYSRVYNHLEWINKTLHSSACNLRNIFVKYIICSFMLICILK